MFDTTNNLVHTGNTQRVGDWAVSEWNAGWLSAITTFTRDRVRIAADGAAEVILGSATPGSYNATGGEMKSGATLQTGTFSWTAQAPEMVDGAVFGMFVRRAQNANDHILEFDWEFVGHDTTKIQCTVHMEDWSGHPTQNVTHTVIDLGFDAAEGVHEYEMVFTGRGVVYRVDDTPVAYFSADDMPGNLWYSASMRSYVNLWAGGERTNDWAGTYSPLASPIKGRILDAEIRSGDLSGRMPLLGDAGGNTIQGTDSRDVIDAFGGDDTLNGGLGHDRVKGGAGNDHLGLDDGNDVLDGGAGNDWLVASGSTGVAVNLGMKNQQVTGLGSDQILNIENVQGTSEADRLTGSTEANILQGGAGNDALRGQAGADTLVGGAGKDLLVGGSDLDRDVFVFTSATDSAVGSTVRDIINNVVHGVDDIDLSGIDANAGLAGDQAFAWGGITARAHGLWTVINSTNIVLKGDVTGDGRADFEIQVNGVHALDASDLMM